MNTHEHNFLTTSEAAEAYGLSVRLLLHHLRTGQIPGHKERGVRGYEWRIEASDIEALGYRRRTSQAAGREDLLKTIQRLRELVAHERRRADSLDGRLGEAAMEIGRLRAELDRAQNTTPRVVDLNRARTIPAARESAKPIEDLTPRSPAAPPRRGH